MTTPSQSDQISIRDKDIRVRRGGSFFFEKESSGSNPSPQEYPRDNFSPSHKGHAGRNIGIIVVTILTILLLLGTIGYYYSPNVTTSTNLTSTTLVVTTTSASSIGQQFPSFQSANPDFNNGKATVSYPANYSTLANYSLSLINKDRAGFGLSSVIQSPIESGQQHADYMSYFGYFSHWDTQGYKPYMRYTMLGGTGSVDENVALDYCMNSSDVGNNSSEVIPVPCTILSVENALNDSEWQMMYNDFACCNNGHRENILNPMHNRVSIGVAYNTSSDEVLFVEDFENHYINSINVTCPSCQTTTIRGNMIGAVDLTPWPQPTQSGSLITVYYDPLPINISVSSLNLPCGSASELNCTNPYSGAYGSGTFLGEVFGPCPQGYTCSNQLQGGGAAIYATTWQTSGSSFDIQFSLSSLVQQDGNGVYTLYLYPNNSNHTLTSFSVFVGS